MAVAPVVAGARGIVKRFAPDAPLALNGVDIAIEPGVMTGLVGPDGAGKTTLIRVLAGLIEPDAGEAIVFGQPATQADRREIGYMPQRFGLYEDLSVGENLRLYADLRGLERELWAERLPMLLEFTGLAPFEARLAGKLSGGMKQKLGLACALVRKPKLLLLDEPGVGVDPISRRELWALVTSLLDEGIAVLWSTSYLDEAAKCHAVTLLREGEPLYQGPPQALAERMRGRVFTLNLPDEGRRAALRLALEDPAVIDGAIRGATVRLAMRESAPLPALAGSTEPAKPAEPVFEDGFIDIIGEGGQATSRLIDTYRDIPTSDAPAIEAVGLTKKFGEFTAARDIHFTVAPGQVFGLLGPNGAGKSTTFKMLCGLLTPTDGRGAIVGHDLMRAGPDARQSLGYMAQKFSLYGDLSVRQNLEFFCGAYGVPRNEARDAIARAVDLFHLERYLKSDAGTLPLGYKQRLALACAVLHQPPVIFLDEPTSGVDPIVRREFWSHINGLVEKGVAVLVTTHFMEEAEFCDRIALIYQSEQIATGTPDELKAQGGDPDGTMEDAFIALIEAFDRKREREAQAA